MKRVISICVGLLLLVSCKDEPVGPDGNDKSSEVTGGVDTLIVDPVTPPLAPILQAPADGTELEGSVEFIWKEDTAYTDYILEISRGSTPGSDIVVREVLQVCRFEVDEFDGGESYAWRVGGVWKDTTIWSPAHTFRIAETSAAFTRCTLTFRGLNCIADYTSSYSNFGHEQKSSGTTIAQQNVRIVFTSDSAVEHAFSAAESASGLDGGSQWSNGRSLQVAMDSADSSIRTIKFRHGAYYSSQHAGNSSSSDWEFKFDGTSLSVHPAEPGVYVIRDTVLLHTHFTYGYSKRTSSWLYPQEYRSYSAKYTGIQFADSTVIELRFE